MNKFHFHRALKANQKWNVNIKVFLAQLIIDTTQGDSDTHIHLENISKHFIYLNKYIQLFPM